MISDRSSNFGNAAIESVTKGNRPIIKMTDA